MVEQQKAKRAIRKARCRLAVVRKRTVQKALVGRVVSPLAGQSKAAE